MEIPRDCWSVREDAEPTDAPVTVRFEAVSGAAILVQLDKRDEATSREEAIARAREAVLQLASLPAMGRSRATADGSDAGALFWSWAMPDK